MTEVPLKDYFDDKIDTLRQQIREAKNDMDKRLDGMNEFRRTLKDQASTFATRESIESRFESLEKSRKDNLALGISLLTLVMMVILFLIKN